MSSSSGEQEKPDDPYLWLEEVESKESLDFAQKSNEACMKALGNPESSATNTYGRVLEVLQSTDRIPYVGLYGYNEEGKAILMNFWKDAQNTKGLWRQTTMESYMSETTEWETVLDVDALAEKDEKAWVWKGSRPLPRSRDDVGSGQRVERVLIRLSRGGSDAVYVKEFDLIKGDFVPEEEQPFGLSEAKVSRSILKCRLQGCIMAILTDLCFFFTDIQMQSRVSYKSRNVLLVGTDFGPDSLTESGYPRTVREWVRGTKLEDAPIVFEGEKSDVR